MVPRRVVLFIFYVLWLVGAQDLSIMGLFTSYTVDPKDPRNAQTIYSKCFNGLAFETCQPKLPTDVISYQALLPYYRDLASFYGQSYCLACCGTPINYVDTWDLFCDVDEFTRTQANVYGFELRLARNAFEGDTDFVWCPLRRSACTYKPSGKVITCDRPNDRTYLVGYTVTVKVSQYSSNFRYWRGASSCSIVSEEADAPLNVTQTFRETIIMDHTPARIPDYQDTSKLLFLLLFVCVAVYGTLYACRRNKCVYCQQKLVFSISLCIKCRLVGAEPPDPVLLRVLEEKGRHLQGDLPERFPGARRIADCLRGMFRTLCCCFRRARVVPTLYVQTYEGGESKQQQTADEEQQQTPKQKQKQKRWYQSKDNPNLLPYEEHIIGAAAGHRDFVKKKPSAKPPPPHR